MSAQVIERAVDDIVGDDVVCQQCLTPQHPSAMTTHRGHRLCLGCKQSVMRTEAKNALRRRMVHAMPANALRA
jgi:hypothetical protein